MAESDKRKVNPGLVQSASKYGKTKVSANPTMQVAVEALPSAEKESTFTEMYAESLALSWVPVSSEEVTNIQSTTVSEPVTKFKKKPEDKSEQPKTKKKSEVKVDKIDNIPKAPAPKIPSDMEIVLNQGIQEVKSEKVFAEEPTDIPAEESAAETQNVFEAINSMPVVEEHKEEHTTFTDEKPFMKVDKVEIRKTTNSEGVDVYMIDKQISNQEEFIKYLQGVYGKLLAADCKKLEYNGITYERQSGGMYSDNQGIMLTADDVISALSA